MKIDGCLSTIRRQMKAVLYHFRVYVSLNKQFVKKKKINQLVLPRIRLFKHVDNYISARSSTTVKQQKQNEP